MNKPLSKKAAKIAETAKASGGMFVFATRDQKLIDAKNTSAVLSKFKFTEHACADCGHKFQAVAAKGLQYHCNSCGSGKTEAASAEVAKLDLPTDDDLTLITCGSCGTHNIMASAVVASVNQMNCSACGHEMNYKTTASAEEADADEMPMNDMDPITDVDDMDLVEIDDVMEDDSGDELFDDEATADTTGMDVAPVSAKTKTTAGDNIDKYGTPPLEDQGHAGDNDPAPDPDAERRKGIVENKSTDESLDIEVDLSDVVTERPSADVRETDIPAAPAIAFVYLGDAMNVAVGNTIVATLTPENAGENAERMFQRNFQLAVKHSIETLGLKEALKNYGFQTAKITIKAGPQIAKMVKEGIEEKTKQVTASLDGAAEDFQQSVDIAAAGWAQNFWRNHTSPVKAALVSELTAAGLRAGSAEKLVDRVFAAHGVADVRTMLTIARDLAAKPVEARNGLAEAVNLAKYLPHKAEASQVEEADAGEDEDEDNEVVATIATSVSSVDKSDNQVTAHYKSPELAAILGDKSFSS